MSLFSEQNARLLAGLLAAKDAIIAKKGTVKVANSTPQIEEIVAGIATVKAGGGDAFDLIPISFLTYNCSTIVPQQGGVTWEDPIHADELLGYPSNWRILPTASYAISKPSVTWSDNVIEQLNP